MRLPDDDFAKAVESLSEEAHGEALEHGGGELFALRQYVETRRREVWSYADGPARWGREALLERAMDMVEELRDWIERSAAGVAAHFAEQPEPDPGTGQSPEPGQGGNP